MILTRTIFVTKSSSILSVVPIIHECSGSCKFVRRQYQTSTEHEELCLSSTGLNMNMIFIYYLSMNSFLYPIIFHHHIIIIILTIIILFPMKYSQYIEYQMYSCSTEKTYPVSTMMTLCVLVLRTFPIQCR